ncbi:hypothetical protein BCV70DRAFT_201607 [Testicularia cyperi]|uniref:Uncharacterized protein n=1 Tax=Testicularia cyperi TaxID=1882483 RepID=A0A317XKJ7_9BASI|nr:hypothetical protein BCV70DRAFT_201607 [Testicularia cyperi]
MKASTTVAYVAAALLLLSAPPSLARRSRTLEKRDDADGKLYVETGLWLNDGGRRLCTCQLTGQAQGVYEILKTLSSLTSACPSQGCSIDNEAYIPAFDCAQDSCVGDFDRACFSWSCSPK